MKLNIFLLFLLLITPNKCLPADCPELVERLEKLLIKYDELEERQLELNIEAAGMQYMRSWYLGLFVIWQEKQCAQNMKELNQHITEWNDEFDDVMQQIKANGRCYASKDIDRVLLRKMKNPDYTGYAG